MTITMREIIFRGKHKYHDGKVGEWVYGSLSVMSGGGRAFIIDHSKDCIYEVAPDTVGQYTGLEDCTDVMRIYEGDILRDYTGEKVKVVWNDGAYWTTGGSLDEPLTETLAQGCKVIGNVHDGVEG